MGEPMCACSAFPNPCERPPSEEDLLCDECRTYLGCVIGRRMQREALAGKAAP